MREKTLEEIAVEPVRVDGQGRRIYPCNGYVCVDFISPREVSEPYWNLYTAAQPMAAALLAVLQAFDGGGTGDEKEAALQRAREAVWMARTGPEEM